VDAQEVGGFGGEFDAGVGDDGHGAPADAVAGADQDRTVVADVPDGRPAPSSSATPLPSPLSHTEPLTTKREITRRPELSLQGMHGAIDRRHSTNIRRTDSICQHGC
jgi:hypothetical protein